MSYTGTVVDCDIHHEWPSEKALLPYFSEGWREYVEASGRISPHAGPGGMMPVTAPRLFPSPISQRRPESIPKEGLAGSDYDLMNKQLLEPFRVERGILGYGSGAYIGAIPNPYFAVEIARASNDWCIDQWLSKDKRLFGSVLVTTQVPEEGAKEIRRVGQHNQMAQALLVSNPLGMTFGHPIYHPIYEAATEVGIPLAIHSGGQVVGGTNVSPIASGFPCFYIENHVLHIQGMMSHVVSLILHGVFEKFPKLKLMLIEGGVAWLPALLWRLDGDYKAVRREVPWLRRLPSEYFQDHVRVTTQPLDTPKRRGDLVSVLDTVGGENLLCFSSDYPHWDTDEVDYVARALPESWHAKVFLENALEFYGWEASESRS